MKYKKYKGSAWGPSLKYPSWDGIEREKSNCEVMISSTFCEWYEAKHRKISKEEITYVNETTITKCPFCNENSFIKYGHYKTGIQKYYCKKCNKKFSPLTNTIFDSKKIPITEWIEYLMHLFEFHSIRSSSRDNRNAESTGKYWLKKVFSVLKDIQKDVILEDKIYIDEAYFPVIKSDTVLKDGKKLRGISRNKIGVTTALDNHNHFYLYVTYTSKPSDESTWNAIGSHIKEGSTLIHDGERSHGVLIRNLNLKEEVYKTKDTTKLDDKNNPLNPINNFHALLKRFMKNHGAYDRNGLQDWMNLFYVIISPPYNRDEKIRNFIELALTKTIKLRYRNAMGAYK